jgi:hypothetical protein
MLMSPTSVREGSPKSTLTKATMMIYIDDFRPINRGDEDLDSGGQNPHEEGWSQVLIAATLGKAAARLLWQERR